MTTIMTEKIENLNKEINEKENELVGCRQTIENLVIILNLFF